MKPQNYDFFRHFNRKYKIRGSLFSKLSKKLGNPRRIETAISRDRLRKTLILWPKNIISLHVLASHGASIKGVKFPISRYLKQSVKAVLTVEDSGKGVLGYRFVCKRVGVSFAVNFPYKAIFKFYDAVIYAPSPFSFNGIMNLHAISIGQLWPGACSREIHNAVQDP
jgi:hypothetical protein